MSTPTTDTREYVTASLEKELQAAYTPEQVALLVHMFNQAVQLAKDEIASEHGLDATEFNY